MGNERFGKWEVRTDLTREQMRKKNTKEGHWERYNERKSKIGKWGKKRSEHMGK